MKMGKWKWIGLIGLGVITFKIAHNYIKMNYLNISNKITPYDEVVIKIAKNITSISGEVYNIEQLLDVFDYMRNLEYVDDPNPYDTDLPRITLLSEKGDCDEFAVATASLIDAIGGKARVVTIFTEDIGHAFCEVYMGKEGNIQNVYLPYLKRYGDYPIGWEIDQENGEWLLFDTLLPAPGLLNEAFMTVQDGTWNWLPGTKVRYFT
jgi:hypothetical protein